ncbi:MAG: SpoIIE family protein phosphatase [Planctomycetes bacterium]|nr:SpoIIE family protein phosphatase [Planctomycetota bacterium]
MAPDRIRGHHRGEERGARFRLPVAVKFTALMGTVAVLLVIFVGLRNFHEGVGEIEAAVDGEGIRLVTLISETFSPYWVRIDEATGQVSRATSDEIRVGFDTATARLHQIISEPAIQGQVLDILLMGEGDGVYARAVSSESLRTSGDVDLRVPEAERAGISVSSVTYSDGRIRIPARRYKKPMILRDAPVGYAEVWLAAQRIDQIKRRLSSGIVYSAIIAAIVGAGVSFLLATLFTRPIRQLARDMRVASTGNLEHRSTVRTSDELGDLARTFNRMIDGLKEAQATEADRKLFEQELKIATQIQQNLLPSQVPKAPGLDIAAYYMSAKEVGGDYYDFLAIDPHRLGIIVADVSGKGVPGSLVMTMTRSLIHLAAAEEGSPRETLIRVNRILARDMAPGMFVTAIYMVLDVRDFTLRIARAGHNEAILIRDAGGAIESIRPEGIALGMDREGRLFGTQLEEREISLSPGDFISIYTDGIVEGMDPAAKEYGADRFRELLASCRGRRAEAVTNRVLEDLNTHRRGADQSDDITIVVIRRA